MSDQNLTTPKMVIVEQSPKGIIFRESALHYTTTRHRSMRHKTRSTLLSVCSRFTQSAAAPPPRGVTRIEVENFYPFSRFAAKSNHC